MSQYFVWGLLAAPLVLLTYNYVYEAELLFGEVYYGGYVHDTGRWAAWALLAALAVTPLRLTFPANAVLRWYARQRRAIGVAAFAYAAAHLCAYLARQDGSVIRDDFADPAFWTGWIAFAVFAALALTSNDLSMRLMRRGWKMLHRLIHPAAILVFAHWALTAFDPVLAYGHIAALAALECYRLYMIHRPRRVAAA